MLIGSDVQKPHVRSADTAKIEDAASNRYALIDDDLILRHWHKDADGAARHPFSVSDDSPCPWTLPIVPRGVVTDLELCITE